MSTTSIEWTDTTWNPVRGCSPVSPGCKNCYAERIAARNLPGHRSPTTGEPFAILKSDGPHWTGKVELIESKLLEPLHWRKPRRVFVNSMSDLFHENLPDEAIDRIFAVMALTPHITYQVLTKRARRMREYLSCDSRNMATMMEEDVLLQSVTGNGTMGHLWPLPNVWLGVSVENEPTAEERIPELLRTPAAVRFVSYEPALAEVDFTPYLYPPALGGVAEVWLDWGIIGGESGPGARPFYTKWARVARDDFQAAGVPLFIKQMGSNPYDGVDFGTGDPLGRVGYTEDRKRFIKLKDSKGGNWDEWPEDLRVREFPDRSLSGPPIKGL